MKNEDTQDTMLAKLFGSTSRARILSLFLGNPRTSYYQREVMFETGQQSLQATQRELGNLVELGVIIRDEQGSKVYYRLNGSSPLAQPLSEILGHRWRHSNEPVPAD